LNDLLILEPYFTIKPEVVFMRSNTKKATFSLPVDILKALDEVVAQGGAPSKNSLVEQALSRELKDLRRQSRLAQWREAAKDPLLLKDLADAGDDFESADAETARRIG
jgi:hypothetical protein